MLEASPALALIAHAAGTVKAHVAEECWDRGITVTTAAQANGVPVAEYTLAYILLAGKDAAGAQNKLRAQRSRYVPDMIAPGLGMPAALLASLAPHALAGSSWNS
ncbi:hypothetical protein NHF46_15440 [Arthrobacter alpinus]|nr:hypothetical protein [Arthrobacter alpinus]